MTPDQLRAALSTLGISQSGLARTWRVDPRTVRRWALGQVPVPPWVEVALAATRQLAAAGVSLAA